MDWITGPPSPEQVAEHARKYSFAFKHGRQYGLWLVREDRALRPEIRQLAMDDRGNATDNWNAVLIPGQYLPLTADGLPVDYAALRKVVEAAKKQAGGRYGEHFRASHELRDALKELEDAR